VVSSEEVVEAYFRCLITHSLARRYDVDEVVIPNCINASHRAVRRVCAAPGHTHATIEDHAWQGGWSVMRHKNPEVDIVVDRSSAKRADLYVAAADEVVSVEFKYVGPTGLRGLGACAAQLALHAAHHAEAISVLYSETPVPGHMVRQLAQQSSTGNVRILNVVGPEIPVARVGGRLTGH
jgi:hypothetical protein